MSFVFFRLDVGSPAEPTLELEQRRTSGDPGGVGPTEGRERGETLESQQAKMVVGVVTVALVAAWCLLAWLLRPTSRVLGGGRRLAIAVWATATVATLVLAMTLG